MIPFAANALECIANEEANSHNCPFPLEFSHPVGGGPSHCNRQHAQRIGKDRARGSTDMLANNMKQTVVTGENVV